jgi:hypothetical protein
VPTRRLSENHQHRQCKQKNAATSNSGPSGPQSASARPASFDSVFMIRVPGAARATHIWILQPEGRRQALAQGLACEGGLVTVPCRRRTRFLHKNAVAVRCSARQSTNRPNSAVWLKAPLLMNSTQAKHALLEQVGVERHFGRCGRRWRHEKPRSMR